MRRCVKEVAKMFTLHEKYEEKCPVILDTNRKIQRILDVCEKGLITDCEAIKEIVDVVREHEDMEARREADEKNNGL